MSFLSSFLDEKRKAHYPFILLQSSAAQSGLPILRRIVETQQKTALVLVCLLYHPRDLGSLPQHGHTSFNWAAEVPGYSDVEIDWQKRSGDVKSAIKGV